MSASTSNDTSHAADHHGDHDDHHHEIGFLQKYFFSTDHKTIGIQYGIVSLFFILFAFFLMMVMRWSIANADEPLPGWMSMFFSENWRAQWLNPDGTVKGSTYNMFGAMHGTIMVFLGVVPLGFAAFGNYVTPLQIGAPDMAFPKLNMMSFWLYLPGGLMMIASFFLDTGAAQAGWTNYSPLAGLMQSGAPNQWMTGQTWWLLAMVFLISSSLLGSVNFLTTIINLRAKGLTWMRLPFFVWAMLVTGFLLLLAFPPLEAAALMQLSDRVFGSSFFLPTGLATAEGAVAVAGGGSPLLYQHLFWFLGHPEVYVLLLPAIACVAEIIPCNTRKPLWGYRPMVWSVLLLGFLSFIVWAHHMYITGMGPGISMFFQTTTVLISIPSVILLTSMIISMWGGSIRFTVPMLWATAFIPMFGIGGLTGLPLAFNLVGLHLHDTYYVIGHFHYVVAPGILFGLFAGIYHWYPKITGRSMNKVLGHLHFWPSLIFINFLFAPMLIQGMAGFHRRWFNGGDAYLPTTPDSEDVFANTVANFIDLNSVMSTAAFLLAISQVPFIFNVLFAWVFGKKVNSDNPWDATTLEWATPTPPGHGNFTFEPAVYRGPYEYSRPDCEEDYLPQWHEPRKKAEVTASADDAKKSTEASKA